MTPSQAAPATIAQQMPFSNASSGNAVIGMLMQQIGSAQWDNYNVLRWTWYDYVTLPNTGLVTTQIPFFVNPKGTTDPVSGLVKNQEDTNMNLQGQFGQIYFIIQQIRTHFQLKPKARQNATVAAETAFSYDQLIFANRMKQLLLTGVLQINIGTSLFFQQMQPFRTMPPGFGLDDSVIVPFDSATNATGNAYIAQSNNLMDVFNLTPPQMIEPTQTFTAVIQFQGQGYNFSDVFDAAAQNANVEAGLIFDGYIAKPVQ